jgi:hypothetical protein
MRRGAAAILAVALALGDAGAGATVLKASPTIRMRDGVRLAVDVTRPNEADDAKVPAILVMSPYGRATRLSAAAIEAFAASGFAVVSMDARGTGASQGHVLGIFTREERDDLAVAIAWVAGQPWSDGRVITTGVSYDGNLAALALAAPGAHIAGAVPRFIDFDTYRDLAVPGGVRNEMLLRGWGELTDRLNFGEACLADAAACEQAENLEPVDGDVGYGALRAALLDHQRNWRPYLDTRGYQFRDDVLPTGRPIGEGFISTLFDKLKVSSAPVQIWGSWFDASTADGALAWYQGAPNAKVELFLGAWTHGGGARADPFVASKAEDEPGAPRPALEFLDFAHRALATPAEGRRLIHYYTAGAALWRTTVAWPPVGIAPARWYLDDRRRLDRAPPAAAGADRYDVDFKATTGQSNRWTTQLGGGPVDYGDRSAEDRKLLAYTSAPLARAIEITGAPMAVLRLSSTRPDGALFVYLEAVGPDGRSIYLSEGELRLTLRGPIHDRNDPSGVAPSFRRADMAPLKPGEALEVAVPLHAVSVVVPQQYRLRLAIAGADADTFERYPPDGDLAFTIVRSAARPSFIELPQATWTGGAR